MRNGIPGSRTRTIRPSPKGKRNDGGTQSLRIAIKLAQYDLGWAGLNLIAASAPSPGSGWLVFMLWSS